MGIRLGIARILLRPVGIALRGRRAGSSHDVPTRLGFATATGVRQLGVSSTSFRPDGVLPLRFCAPPLGDNISPQLSWTAPPPATKQLLILIEDTDVPLPHPSMHCAALVDPGIQTLSEGELNSKKAPAGVRLLSGSHTRGYVGPFPLPGHGSHRYDHYVIALDEALPAKVTSADEAIRQSVGHILAQGVLSGTQRN